MSAYNIVKQKALVQIKKNDTLFRIVRVILGKNKKRRHAFSADNAFVSAGKANHLSVTEKNQRGQIRLDRSNAYNDFLFSYRLRNYAYAAQLIEELPISDLSDKQTLDVVHCLLSVNRGVEADAMLRSVINKARTGTYSASYLIAVADKVFLSGFGCSDKIETFSVLKNSSVDRDGRAKLDRHLDWLEFRLRNEKEDNLDPLLYSDFKSSDLSALKDNARFFSALKINGHAEVVKDILARMHEETQFLDIFTLRSFLNYWPQWFEGRSIIGAFPEQFKREVSLLAALHGCRLQSNEFMVLYQECLEIQKERYWELNVIQKDALLRVFLRMDLLEVVQELVFADDLPRQVLPGFIARGFKYFENDDYYSARSCFHYVLTQDPADGLASSGLRLAYPRTGQDMREILKIRNAIGYGIKSAGRAGVQPLGSELTIAELMSGNYVAGLYSKRKSKHWLKLERYFEERFFNYRNLPSYNIGGKSLFVIGDEGVGDEIRTAQFYNALSDRFGSVTISCDPRLFNLFSLSFPEITFIPVRRFRKGVSEPGEDEQPRLIGFDEKIASYLTEECRFSLDAADCITFGQNLFFNYFIDNLPRPSAGSYLQWPALASSQESSNLRVGLLWRSHFKSRMRDFMYLSVEDFLPLTQLQGVELWSVQHCIDDEEKETCSRYGISFIEDIDLYNDFEGLSGYLQSMDILIGISSVPIELGAALGVEVWMLGFSPENYYLRTEGGRDSHDRYTLNSTVIAPPWIDFSEPRDECVRQVFSEVCRKLDDKLRSRQA
ncbi:hypothetical protein [Stutzerimonas stutzeri]|uniref:hypothetical protein n=1 Tax=Stutzerimonas stutzeri TaxID=316 RepID=UPI000AB505C3|nr:hypothetical protein [Stutzerimonas stutzeri]